MSRSKGGIDWSKCIFCQKESRSCKTTCPGNSKRSDVSCGYKSMSNAIIGYLQYGQLPVDINVQLWDKGDGIEAILTRHRACRHKTCRSRLFHATTLSRKHMHDDCHETRKLLENHDVNSSDRSSVITPHSTHTSSGCMTDNDIMLCFFFNESGNDLCQVMT